jgi:hypothetical protein
MDFIKKAEQDFDYIKNKQASASFFGALSFNGFQTENKTYQQSDGYYSASINGVPKGQKWEKMVQPKIVGKQVEGDLDFGEFEGLLVGECITKLSAYRTNRSMEDKDIFTILQNKATGRKYIYYLAEQLDSTDSEEETVFWKNITPIKNYWLPDGVLNPKYQNSKLPIADADFYDLLGDHFDYINYKDKLYICSGQEYYLGESGYGSILEFDGYNWNSIPAGFCGEIVKTFKPSESVLTEQGLFVDPKYLIDDTEIEFNPSIISTYGDRLAIAGARGNSIQVKIGEWSNPRNFVSNVLNGTNTVVNLTPKDTIRASSFILPSESNNITGMKEFNNSLYISTENGWYVWSLIPSKLSNGSFFELDRIQTDKNAPAGAINQESILTYKNDLLYISNYQIFPEFSKLSIVSNSSGGASSQYRKLTDPIDTFLSYQDFNDSCVGYFKENILVGFSDRLGERKTLMMVPYYDTRNNLFYNYTVIEGIKATSFLTNKRALYYTEKESAYVYKLTPNLYSNIGNKASTSTLTSFIDGFNYKQPRFKSLKTLQEVQILGYFCKNTQITLTLSRKLDFTQDTSSYQDVSNQRSDSLFSFTYTFTEDNSEYDVEQNLGFNDPNYRFGAKYYDEVFTFEKLHDIDLVYNTLVYQIEISTNAYFSLEGCIFKYNEEGDTKATKKTLKKL